MELQQLLKLRSNIWKLHKFQDFYYLYKFQNIYVLTTHKLWGKTKNK